MIHNIKGEVFRYLLNLSQNDEVVLYVGKRPYHYQLARKVLLRERLMPLEARRQNAEWIAPTDHEQHHGHLSAPLFQYPPLSSGGPFRSLDHLSSIWASL